MNHFGYDEFALDRKIRDEREMLENEQTKIQKSEHEIEIAEEGIKVSASVQVEEKSIIISFKAKRAALWFESWFAENIDSFYKHCVFFEKRPDLDVRDHGGSRAARNCVWVKEAGKIKCYQNGQLIETT